MAAAVAMRSSHRIPCVRAASSFGLPNLKTGELGMLPLYALAQVAETVAAQCPDYRLRGHNDAIDSVRVVALEDEPMYCDLPL